MQQRLITGVDREFDWYLSASALAILNEHQVIATLEPPLQRWMQSGSRSTAMVAAYISTKSGFRPPDLRVLLPWAGTAYKHHGYTKAAYRTRVVEEALWRMFRVNIPTIWLI